MHWKFWQFLKNTTKTFCIIHNPNLRFAHKAYLGTCKVEIGLEAMDKSITNEEAQIVFDKSVSYDYEKIVHILNPEVASSYLRKPC